jgi:hypothetical protein
MWVSRRMVALVLNPMCGWLPRRVLSTSTGLAMVAQKVPPQLLLQLPAQARMGMRPSTRIRARAVMADGAAKPSWSAGLGSATLMRQLSAGR